MTAPSGAPESLTLEDWLRIAPTSALIAALVTLVVVWRLLRNKKRK